VRRGFGDAPAPRIASVGLDPVSQAKRLQNGLGKPAPRKDRTSPPKLRDAQRELPCQKAALTRAVALRRLCAVWHLYSAPRHLVLSRIAFSRFVSLFEQLESGSCTIVDTNFGEFLFHAVG
jgi:hypothetical protein